MSDSLSGTYLANRRTADQQELEQWLQQRLAQPPPPAPTPQAPAPPKPPGPSWMDPVTTITGTAWEGVKNFAAGVYGALPPLTPPTSKEEGVERRAQEASGAGQALLGVLQVISALPAGVGSVVETALKKYAPGMEAAEAIPGGGAKEYTPAGVIRTILAAPSLLLDPNIRKLRQEQPDAVWTELNKPMTYGELLNIVSQFVAAPWMAKKGIQALKGGKGAAEAQPAPAVAPPAPREPLALPPRTLVTPPPEAPPAAMTPFEVAYELRTALERLPRPAPEVLRERARVEGRTPLAAPSRIVPEAPPEAPPVPTGELLSATERAMATVPEPPPANPLTSALETALKRSEQIISEAIPKDQAGRIDPGLLARLALGAAAGGTQGDTPEERIRNAFLGMLAGGVLSPARIKAVANKVTGAFKEQGVIDEAGVAVKTSHKGRAAMQASEQPFQPNYEYLNQTPAVRSMSIKLHRAIKEDILERRGPAKSSDATVQEALQQINSGKLTPERFMNMGQDEALTRTEGTALRIFAERSRVELYNAKQALNRGEGSGAEVRAAFDTASILSRNARVAATRKGQELQAYQIEIGGEGLAYRPEDIAAAREQILPNMTGEQIAALFKDATPEQINKAMSYWDLIPGAALEAMYFSYLSGKAITRNAVSLAATFPWGLYERSIARFIPQGKGAARNIVPGEATQMAIGLGEALVDHWRMFRRFERMDQAALKMGFSGSSKMDRAYAARITSENFRLDPESTFGQFVDWTGKIFRAPGDILQQTDMASKGINGRMAYRSEALRQAVTEGHTGEALVERHQQLLNDITLLNEQARQRIIDYGERHALTKPFESLFMQALAKGPDNGFLNALYRAVIVPFFRTPARMLEEQMMRQPGLNMLTTQFWGAIRKGGAEAQHAKAKLVAGASAVGAFAYLESQGVITGNAPKDPKLRKLWDAAGYQERSFWDPVSQKWRSYDGLGYLTGMVAGAADVSRASRLLPEADFLHLFVAYLMSTINSIDSRTFTQSLSNFMEVINNPGDDTQIERAMTFIRKQMAGWVTPGFMREIKGFVDPERRRAMPNGAEDDPLFREFLAVRDEFYSKMPGLSTLKDAEGNPLVPPLRNPITGQPSVVESWPFNPFIGKTPQSLPFTWADGKPGNVWDELRRLNGGGLTELPDWIGGTKPGADFGMQAPDPRAGVRLNGPAKDRWVQLMTQVVRDHNDDTYAKALQRLMATPEYQAAGDGVRGHDGGKADLLRATQQYFQGMATQVLFDEVPALHAKVVEQQVNRQIERVPTAQQPETRRNVQETLRELFPGVRR